MSAQTALPRVQPARDRVPSAGLAPRRSYAGRASVVVLLAACWLLLGFDFSRRGLWSAHEGRAAQHAQVMLETGQWGLPRLFWGEPDLQKPPLYYWLVAGTAKLRGGPVGEFAVRLPSLAAAIMLLALVAAIGASWWGRNTGMLAAVILCTMPRFWWLARVGRIDMPLACFVGAAMACFWFALDGQNRSPLSLRLQAKGWSLTGFVVLGMGVLLKGPVAVLLPAVALAAYAIARRRLPNASRRTRCVAAGRRLTQTARRLRLGSGLLVVLCIAGPWFLWAGFQTRGALWSKFFVYHNWQRALGGAEALEGRHVAYYLTTLWIDTFPWSLLALVALGGAVANRQARIRSRPARFCICWAAGMFVLLSLVRFKRQDYLLPLYPAMALLVAHWLVDVVAQRNANGAANPSRVVFAGFAVVALCVSSLLLFGLIDPQSGQVLLPNDPLGNLVRDAVGRLQWSPLAEGTWIGIAVLSAGACLLCAARRRCVAAAGATALVMAMAQLGIIRAVLPTLDTLHNQRPFAATIREIVPEGREVIFHRMENHDLVFYTGRPARVVVPTKGLRSVLDNPQPTYVVLRLRCSEPCEGKCIGGCLRRRREEWPDLHLELLATNRGLGDGKEQLALIVNGPSPLATAHAARTTIPSKAR